MRFLRLAFLALTLTAPAHIASGAALAHPHIWIRAHATLQFQNGKIVRASANEIQKLNAILNSDEGARYCGEWAIGVNNRVRHPMLDTLFDEKIGGSFHLTPGQAYEIADNGNRSRIHWDLVLIQRPDYGGGEMYFDGELIRKDGRFVPGDLQGLNTGL